MDIGSNNSYPSSNLSNFHGDRFYLFIDECPKSILNKVDISIISSIQFDENNRRFIICNSREGALQSLKFKQINQQIECSKLIGLGAKRKGQNRNKAWKSIQMLWFLEVPIKRDSPEYQELLNFIFESCYKQNAQFRKALESTQNIPLYHSIGKNNEKDTILTVREFCGGLTKLRDYGKL